MMQHIKNFKILLVEISGKGGICHYSYNLAQAISKYHKTVLITGFDYELRGMVKNFELIEIFNRFKTSPIFIVKLIKIFKEREVSVIHFQVSQYPIFILFLCCLSKIFTNKKIVITAHNVVSHEEIKWEKKIYMCLYNLVDKIIVHALSNKKEIIKEFSIDDQHINVIPHGNYEFFDDKQEKKIEPENRFNILFFGYIRKYKGLIYLIRALSLVKQKLPGVRLFIVGKAVEGFKVYQEEIDKLGLRDCIEINLKYVPIEQVKDYFYKTNVVVLPYVNVFQSGILQLAYGFGKPVVATNVGGLHEVVENGLNGFIIPPKDVIALSEKIVTILSDRELQQKMGNYALHLAKTKFSWDSIALKTLELYKSILN